MAAIQVVTVNVDCTGRQVGYHVEVLAESASIGGDVISLRVSSSRQTTWVYTLDLIVSDLADVR